MFQQLKISSENCFWNPNAGAKFDRSLEDSATNGIRTSNKCRFRSHELCDLFMSFEVKVSSWKFEFPIFTT